MKRWLSRLSGASILLAISAGMAQAYTGATCVATDSESRSTCIAMIGAVRELISDGNSADPACARVGSDDVAMTEGVIDWIKARPERQNDDLANLIREALLGIDPCAQRSLIPQMQPGDPLDMD